MSGSRQLAEHFADQLTTLGRVDVRRFFGGWSLHLDGTQIAIVMDTLYLRADEDLADRLRAAGGAPFTYVARGRTVTVGRYVSVPECDLDDHERLMAWLPSRSVA